MKRMGTILALLFVIFPAFSHGATLAELQAQIQVLQAQLQVLIAQTQQGTAVPTSCPNLTRNLSRGSRGEDVRQLQQFLISQNLLASDSATGFFGALTERAVQQWQAINGIVSSGSPSTTGYGAVGPKTRAAMAKCAPTSFGVSAGSTATSPLNPQPTVLAQCPASPASISCATVPLRKFDSRGCHVGWTCSVSAQVTGADPSTSSGRSGSEEPSGSMRSSSGGGGGGGTPQPSPSPTPTPTYAWQTSGWSTCTNSTQSRTVSCTSSNATSVSDSNCASSKPSTSQSCTVSPTTSQCIPLQAEGRQAACPTGQTGAVTQTRTSACAAGASSPTWSAWTTTTTACTTPLPSTQSCALDGLTIAHGASQTFYGVRSVAYGALCSAISQSRNCSNGSFSGSATYAYANCSPESPRQCSFNGDQINHGAAVTATLASTVPFGQTCQSQTRTCTNGNLSGSYTFASCTPGSPAACLLDGVTVNHGSAFTFYSSRTVPYGQNCSTVAQTRSCSNAVLSGSFASASCAVEDPSALSPAFLSVRVVVDNTGGGTKQNNDFSFRLNGGSLNTFEADGTNELAVDPGIYSVTQPDSPGYTTSYDSCSNLSLASGEKKTCTITNTFIATPAPAPTCQLLFSPATGAAGGSTVLYWGGEATASASIDNGIGTLPLAGPSYSGNKLIPIPIQATTYILSAVGTNGAAIQCTATIQPIVTTGFVLPYVSPNATLSPFINFGAGSFESNVMPDTLDLAEHARLSINALTSPLLKEADYELYWFASLNANPPRLDMGGWERLLPQFWTSLQWMRAITGSSSNIDVDKVWQNRLVKSLSPQGSLSFSLYKSYIPNTFEVKDYRSLGAEFLNDIYSQDWALFSLANLYRFTGDTQWKDKGVALVEDLKAHGVYCDGAGAYGPFCYVSAPAYTSNYRGVQGNLITGYASSELGGRLILGMSNFYAATAYAPAKELAQKFVNYLINYGGYFDRTTGAFIWDKRPDSDEKNIGTHFGRHTQALVALTDYAILTGDEGVLQFVINSFNWAKNAPCSDTPSQICTNPIIGWFPEFLDSTWPKSDYAVAEMTQIAVKLSAAGKANLWDDAERWIRNQFSAQQLQDVSWIPSFSQNYSDMASNSSTKCGAGSSAVLCTNENVPERVLGSWGGFVRPNEFLMAPNSSYGGFGVMEDSTAWGSMAVYSIWKHSITRASDYLKVNLLFNRASPWATVYSYIPYTGQVDVKIKDTGIQKLYIRIPTWTDTNQTQVKKNGTAVSFSMTAEGYAYVVGPFANGDIVSATFPISERTEQIPLPANKFYSNERTNFTFTMRGDMIIAVSPQGQRGAFYTDRLRYRGAPQTKGVQNFIFGNQAFLNDYPVGPPPVTTGPAELHIYANGREGTVRVAAGAVSEITWLAKNVKSGTCTVYGPKATPLDSTNIFNGSGSATVSVPGQSAGPITQVSTYTLRCQNADGTQTDPKTLVISPAAPDLHIYANGQEGLVSVLSGSSSEITWNASNVTEGTCRVYGPKSSPLDSANLFNGSGSGNVPAPGQQTGNLAASSIYTLACNRSDGSVRYKTVAVNVSGSQTLTANPTVVQSGGTSMISWSAPSANACVVYGPNDTSTVFNGSGATASPPGQAQGAGPFTQTSTYTLRCWTGGNYADTTATIIVQ